MKNYIQEGKCIELTAPANVTSGTAILIGGLLVVPNHDALSGAKFTGCCEGVFELPKEETTVTFAEGELCHWDVADAEFNDTAASNYACATCVEAAAATDATVKVKLHGFAVPVGT